MKKRKTYEVSVINKTYSKTYSDETKFYTSDTALELNFQLKEVEYDFDSAEIILLNVDDRSLVTRPVTKNADGFTYELEDDIVAHYGEWKGQLKFDEGGEIYVSSPVSFRIENDLTNDRPPQLTEVNTWKNLRKIADGLIADIRSELESVAEQLLEIESAESERQQAETQRASSESSRVSAEEQRKTDHANRSAELAGKADKVVLKNLIKNGDFSDGLTHWTNPSGRVITEIVAEGVKITSTGERGRLQQIALSNMKANDILYVTAMVKTTNKKVSIVDANSPSHYMASHSGSNEFELLSAMYSMESGYYYPIVILPIADIVAILQWQMAINLTDIFGGGNEPTKEEMDELIKVTGYFNGEYAINNREMFGYLLKGIREKADKKQEDWITATLINGATGTVQYRKDKFGMVQIQGRVSIPNPSLQPFLIPFGYRPRQTFSNAVTTINNNNNVYKFTMGASGSNFLNAANIEVDLTGVNFEAGG